MKNRKCNHGKRQSNCRDCVGINICLHGKQRWHCLECPKNICEHNKLRRHCRSCSPKSTFAKFLSKVKSRKLLCSLSYDEWYSLTGRPCHYCGSPTEAGIDRVDSNQDYTLENSVSCCNMCNFMKRTYSKESFLSHVRKIFEHQARI
jgi:hypothetical protein